MLAPPPKVSTRLIHIYRKSTGADPDRLATNSSPSEQVGWRIDARAIEFASPMKRIMELIGQHAPVVVLSDSSSTDRPSVQQQQQSAATQGIASSAPMEPPIEPSQAQWPLTTANQQQQPAAEGQQLTMQPTMGGYEQYYLSPSQLAEQRPIALVPANLAAFSAPNNFQPTAPYFQAMQPAQPQLMAAQPEEGPQPIFLSSYSPELAQPALAPVQPAPAQLVGPAGPSSIQQSIGQQHARPQAQAPPPSQAEQQDEGADDSSEASPEGADDGSDEGSLSYEDKYDSDKARAGAGSNDEARHAEPSSSASTNGLVSVGLNDDCLQCICRASSGCDHLLRCITRGADEKHCGPFQLTEEYWQRAGSPGDASTNFQSFEECANEADCAVETVTNYMKKYHRDCDGDDNITCMDYARLHRLKPNECSDTDKLANEYDAYWAKFQRCAEGYNRSRNGDDEDI